MNITSINTIQNIYSPTRNKPNAVADAMYERALKKVYSPSEISSSSESSSRTSMEFKNKNFYRNLTSKAVISSERIAEQKKNFTDMYVTSVAHKYFSDNQSKAASSVGLLTFLVENSRAASREECMPIPIESGKLPRFMDMVQNSLKNGMSLKDIF